MEIDIDKKIKQTEKIEEEEHSEDKKTNTISRSKIWWSGATGEIRWECTSCSRNNKRKPVINASYCIKLIKSRQKSGFNFNTVEI